MPYKPIKPPAKDPAANTDKMYYQVVLTTVEMSKGNPNVVKNIEKLIESFGCKDWESVARIFIKRGESEGYLMALAYSIFPQLEVFDVPFSVTAAAKAIMWGLNLGSVFSTLLG